MCVHEYTPLHMYVSVCVCIYLRVVAVLLTKQHAPSEG